MNNTYGVLLCSRNGERTLKECLGRLCAVVANSSFSIKVALVDNNSTDSTFSIFSTFAQKYPKFVFHLKERRPGKTNALLTGISILKCDYVAIVDDDNYINSTWLEKSCEALERDCMIGVLGCRTRLPRESESGFCLDPYTARMLAVGSQGEDEPGLRKRDHVWGAGSWINVSALSVLFEHGWLPVLSGRTGRSLVAGEDTEICYALGLGGYKILYDSSTCIEHDIDLTRASPAGLRRLAFALGYSQPILGVYRSVKFYGSWEILRITKLYLHLLALKILRSDVGMDRSMEIRLAEAKGRLASILWGSEIRSAARSAREKLRKLQ